VTSVSCCNELTPDTNSSNAVDWKGAAFGDIERNESDLVVADPVTGEVKRKRHSIYPNNSGVPSTAGGLVFTGYTDGTFAAFDDTTLDLLWKINVGTGFATPGDDLRGRRQAIYRDPVRTRPGRPEPHKFTPELRDMRNQTMLFVFGL
jgi:alcohol dehydrogenase (cytochrome c)